MTKTSKVRGPIAVGVDLGGSRIRVLAAPSEGTKGKRFTARAPDPSALEGFLQALWKRWRIRPNHVGALVVASKGVWTQAERRGQERRLAGLARRVRVLSDAEAAYLAALGKRAGLLILAGTGSMVLGRTSRGRWVRRGGLGPLFGDEGSAFWIGREWLRASNRHGVDSQTRRLILTHDAVARIAALAPRVLARAAHGDKTARRIRARAQRELALLAVEAGQPLGLKPPIPVSWAGRLMEDRKFRAGLRRALHHAGLQARLVPPLSTASEAALDLALGLCHRQALHGASA
ncbi:MAG: BadF/BadG/BcrA/BcrD ATPase family protein [Candidatus Methylomirabilia bacterium]